MTSKRTTARGSKAPTTSRTRKATAATGKAPRTRAPTPAKAQKKGPLREQTRSPRDPDTTDGRMRSLPQQERARLAVERILDATGELLDEAGFESLTTTAIAERAEVNIATLYRYFPDKFKVVHEFAVRRDRERWEAIRPLLEQFATSPDWRRALDALIAGSVRLRLEYAGGRTLRRALQSSPELWQVNRELDVRASAVMAEAIRQRKPRIPKPQAQLIAATMITAGSTLLDHAVSEHDDHRKAVAEALKLLRSYLAGYLD
jgi:AcrR family transcriptional regulator